MLKTFIPQQKEPTPTSFEKLTIAPTLETEAKIKMVEQVRFNMLTFNMIIIGIIVMVIIIIMVL